MAVSKTDLAPGDENPRMPDAPKDGYGFVCDGDGPFRPCGFASSGWPSRSLSDARWRQHKAEHDELIPTPSLNEFRLEHGLGPDGKPQG